MNETHLQITRCPAEMSSPRQEQRTGRARKAVSAILAEDTLVVTLHDALTPIEKALVRTPEGASQVQGFHRQLFSSSREGVSDICRITGREVREAIGEIEPATSTVMHAFTTGAMVKMSPATPEVVSNSGTDRDSNERADIDGFQSASETTRDDSQ